MDRMDYVQAATRTRVLEKKLLSKARVDRMIDAKDIGEVFKILSETDYANAVAGISRDEDYENILSHELKRVYKMMREMAKDQVVVDLMALKYDYHNLKVLVKERKLNKDLSKLYIPVGTTDFRKIRDAFIEGNLRDIQPEFREAIEAVVQDFEVNKDPQRIDIIFDRFYFRHLFKMAEETGIQLFVDYVKDMIDFINIKSSIRLKKQGKDMSFLEEVLLPNGNIDKDVIMMSFNDSVDNMITRYKNYRIGPSLMKGLESYRATNRLSDLEKYMDNYLVEINKPSKYVNFGPEPIFSYLVAKEAEIKTLRIIMVSKLNKLSPDATRERVRELYV
ncbi:MAG TPA: V-type ATP synthase subunit C [Clostridiales bacterium]|nr:V-type ATP synthase subunit C [Clostridiales bacterium]